MRVHLGLGSNLGDRWSELVMALEVLSELDDELEVSPVYETAAVGGPEGQGPYLNCVVRIETDLGARELLGIAQDLERRAGRVRREHHGPRTLDVDILLIEGVTCDEADLVVPHPRMFDRAFVLAPLEQLDPLLVPSNWRERLGGDESLSTAVRRAGTLVRSTVGSGGPPRWAARPSVDGEPSGP